MNFLANIWCAVSVLSLAVRGAIPHPSARSDAKITLTSGRNFQIFAPGPNNAACNRPHSVMLAFHGRGGTPSRMRDVSHFHVDDPCLIVIYPRGSPSPVDGRLAWQPAPYADTTVDDYGFVEDILDWVANEYREWVDMSRVYASGKSNGASIVGYIACHLAHLFACVAPVSGPFYLASDLDHCDPTCSPGKALPVIEFHGTDDEDAPYSHRRTEWNGGKICKVQTWVQEWANRNHCSTPPAEQLGISTEVVRDQSLDVQTYTGCDGGVEVVHHRINHGLHDWQSRSKNKDNTDDESNPSLWNPVNPTWGDWMPGVEEATRVILDFCRRWPAPVV